MAKAVLVHERGIRPLLQLTDAAFRADPGPGLAFSHRHGLICLDDGAVVSFGSNDESQLGRGQDADEDWAVSPAEGLPSGVMAVAVGDTHSAALMATGEVFTWGGLSHVRGRSGAASRPMRVSRGLDSPFAHVTSIACGAEHTIVIDRIGKMHGWGVSGDGQLGLGSKLQNVSRPMEISLPGNAAAVMVACGAKHSLVVSSDLRVFASGVTPATGLDVDCNEFRPIESLCQTREKDPVMRIACGRFHSIAAKRSCLLTFGDGSCGKLGNASEEDQAEPCAVEIPPDAFPLLIVTGGPHHSLIIDALQRLWVCGLAHPVECLMLRDHTEKALRAPQSIAMPRMINKFQLADAILERVLAAAIGEDRVILVLEATKEISILEKSTIAEPNLIAPVPSWFGKMMKDGDDIRVAILSDKLQAAERRCSVLEERVQHLEELLNQLGPHYKNNPSLLMEKVKALSPDQNDRTE